MSSLPAPLRQVDRTFVTQGGRRFSYFGGCDYYRLATHPQVVAAAQEALAAHGFGVAASRATTGNHPLYEELEAWLAGFFRADRALLVGAGYAANAVVAQALAGEVTHAFLDEGAHASLQDAARFLDCPARMFRHCDAADLERRLRALPSGSRPLVLTDGLFGRDGSVAPLAAYLDRLPRRGRLLVDEAHSAGVLGPRGRGTLERCGVTDRRVIRTGTLSKAFGAFGGVVLTDAALAGRVLGRSRWYAASTPIPLPAAAAALAAGRLIQNDAAMRARLRSNTALVKDAARGAGWDVPDNDSPILAVVPSSPARANRLRHALTESGSYPSLIRYPGGPPTGYFRFAVSSEHARAQLDGLTEVLASCARRSPTRRAIPPDDRLKSHPHQRAAIGSAERQCRGG